MVLGYSRLSCVVPVFRQDLQSVIHCFEEAFRFFGGCPKRVVIDGLKACLELADPYRPRFNRNFSICSRRTLGLNKRLSIACLSSSSFNRCTW